MNAKERHFEVDIVHRCSLEGGDSILGVFSWEPLREKLQDYYRAFQVDCSRMRICTPSAFGPRDLSQPMKSSYLNFVRARVIIRNMQGNGTRYYYYTTVRTQ